ncbi:hypothetical protein [uncultured Pseudoalteromonas sp.]|uniref:hypothetical protein n=1 Tax=uncultured Pseudoalteromonas sp. TaxID=114053 RepID=UPI0030C845C9
MDSTDYSQYSKEALFEVLESIDYELHTANALSAYSTLVTKFGVTDNEVAQRYSDDNLIASILKLCFFPFASNYSSSNIDLRNKVAAIKTAH